jgi:hypothetical protein
VARAVKRKDYMSYKDELEAFYLKAKKAVKQSDIRTVKCCANCVFCSDNNNCNGQDEIIFPVKPFFTCKRWKEIQDEKE